MQEEVYDEVVNTIESNENVNILNKAQAQSQRLQMLKQKASTQKKIPFQDLNTNETVSDNSQQQDDDIIKPQLVMAESIDEVVEQVANISIINDIENDINDIDLDINDDEDIEQEEVQGIEIKEEEPSNEEDKEQEETKPEETIPSPSSFASLLTGMEFSAPIRSKPVSVIETKNTEKARVVSTKKSRKRRSMSCSRHDFRDWEREKKLDVRLNRLSRLADTHTVSSSKKVKKNEVQEKHVIKTLKSDFVTSRNKKNSKITRKSRHKKQHSITVEDLDPKMMKMKEELLNGSIPFSKGPRTMYKQYHLSRAELIAKHEAEGPREEVQHSLFDQNNRFKGGGYTPKMNWIHIKTTQKKKKKTTTKRKIQEEPVFVEEDVPMILNAVPEEKIITKEEEEVIVHVSPVKRRSPIKKIRIDYSTKKLLLDFAEPVLPSSHKTYSKNNTTNNEHLHLKSMLELVNAETALIVETKEQGDLSCGFVRVNDNKKKQMGTSMLKLMSYGRAKPRQVYLVKQLVMNNGMMCDTEWYIGWTSKKWWKSVQYRSNETLIKLSSCDVKMGQYATKSGRIMHSNHELIREKNYNCCLQFSTMDKTLELVCPDMESMNTWSRIISDKVRSCSSLENIAYQ